MAGIKTKPGSTAGSLRFALGVVRGSDLNH